MSTTTTTTTIVQRWALSMLLGLPAATAGAESRLEEPRATLRVYLVECVTLQDGLLEAIRDEVNTLYASAGVTIVWLDAAPNPAKPNEARAYILDELPPSLRVLMDSSKGRGPMGITLGPHPRAPGADIYLSRRAVLERAGHRQRLVVKHAARALGRALAHELAHRFLRSGHTEEGMLRAVLTERDLIDGDASDLFLTAEQIQDLETIAMH